MLDVAQQIADGVAVPRAVAEDFVRGIRRTCKGWPVISDLIQQRTFVQVWAGEIAKALAQANAIRLVFRYPPVDVSKGLDAICEQIVMTVRLHAVDIQPDLIEKFNLPQWCGADFNEIVLAGPLDGEAHDYTCPRCGLQGTYRAPHIVIKEDAP